MASSSSVENLSVEETIDIFCDPLLILDASALGYYMDKISTLVAQHGPELQAILPKKDVSPFLTAAKALITDKDSSAIVEILRLLFGAMSPQLIYEKYWKHLADGLADGLPYDIQGLVLFQLLRIAKDSRGCTELANNKQLLAKVVERLDSVVVASVATKVLVVVSSQVPSAHKTLFNEELWELFIKVQNKDSICKMRAFEVYCRIAIQSAETAGKLKPQLEQIVKAFREPHRDTLAQLNYIELLTVLVTSPHTLPFVLESGIITDMKQLLIDVTNPGAVYIMPGVCEFFGRFGENHPHLVCDKYLDIINLMLDMTFNIQFQALAISNLALMGRTDEGKRCMRDKLAVDILVLMKAIGTILEGHDSIKKEAVLSALTHLMEVEDVKQEDLMQLTQTWFSAISAKPIQTVYDCLKNFLMEVRLNAYAALKNIALLSWGHDALLEDCPGFYEWLLHRDPNARKIEVDCKFRIVAALLEDANKISNPEKRAALRAHFTEGPFTLGSSVAGVSSQRSQ